jgi:hypothetical protein
MELQLTMKDFQQKVHCTCSLRAPGVQSTHNVQYCTALSLSLQSCGTQTLVRNSGKTSSGKATLPAVLIQAQAPLAGPRTTVAKATERKRDRRERKQRSEGKSEAVVSSVFVETYQSDRLPHGSVCLAFLRLSLPCPPSFVRLSALSLETTMNSDSICPQSVILGASLPTANAVG